MSRMAAQRQIVVPNAPVPGAVAAAACVGLLHGALLPIVVTWLSGYFVSAMIGAGFGVYAVFAALSPLLLLAPAWFTARTLARLTHRTQVFVLGGLAYGLGFTTAALMVSIERAIKTPGAMPILSVNSLPSIMLWWGAATLPSVVTAIGLFALVRWGTRKLRYSLIPQTGSMCWKCAYDLGSPQVTVCPECGTAAEPGRFRQAWLVCRVRSHLTKARPLLIALIGALAVFVGASYVRHVSPTVRLVNQLKASSHAADAVSFSHLQMASGSAMHAADLAVSTDDGDLPASGVVVGITLWRSPDGGSSLTATLQLMMRVPPPYGPTPMASLEAGSANVVARLDAAQTASIARSGVPASLKKALVAEAARVGWTPTPLPPGTFIQLQPLPVHEVDPDPHFPSPP